MNDTKNSELLGVGPAYPHTRSGGGKFPIAKGTDLVEQGIEQFFLTAKGKRMMEKDLGNGFSRILFSLEGEQRDKALLEMTKRDSRKFEPRAVITGVTVTQEDDSNEIFISVAYINIDTNVSDNAVFKLPKSSAGV